MLCPLWRLAPYSAGLAFADYWKDPRDKAAYLQQSRWLASVNNERGGSRRASYREHMLQLQRYVLIEALNDTMVTPHESESHGFFAWGGSRRVVPMRETDEYRDDAIGLRTLDESGRLVVSRFEGDHLGFSPEFWQREVLAHLGPGGHEPSGTLASHVGLQAAGPAKIV